MADPLWTLVRFLHVGAAIAWIGGATLWGLIVMPTLAQLGPTLPKGVMPTLGGKVVKFLPHAGAFTLIMGLAVFMNLYPTTLPYYRWIMLASLAITALALVLAYAILVPTFKKVSTIMGTAHGPPTPEVQGMMLRIKQVSLANLALGWLVVLLMVIATAMRTT
jgi:uncharacterized membrane protein